MEEWRKVPGFDYEISIATKEGKCRNIKTGNIFVNRPDKRGRLSWSLRKRNVPHTKQAAKWIALTFPELVQNKYFKGAEIDHIDTDRLNNHPSNLRWVTHKENMNNPLTRRRLSVVISNRSEETRKKLSDSLKGRTFSEEHKKHLAEKSLGRLHSDETRQKMSAAHKGKKFTEEHKKKLSEAAHRRYHSK